MEASTVPGADRWYKNLGGWGGSALKGLDRLECLVNPDCIESGKIGGRGGAWPPGTAGPALCSTYYLHILMLFAAD